MLWSVHKCNSLFRAGGTEKVGDHVTTRGSSLISGHGSSEFGEVRRCAAVLAVFDKAWRVFDGSLGVFKM